jgi:hypothetical protein
MKLALAVVAVATLATASAFAQTRPPADPLAVKPVPPQEQRAEMDAIRTKIEQAGFTDVIDLTRDSMGVWRARARKGGGAVDVTVDKGGRIKAEARR